MTTRTTPFILAALALGATVGACTSRASAPAQAPATVRVPDTVLAPMVRQVPGQRVVFAETLRGPQSRRPGEIPADSLSAVMRRLASVRAVPAELQVRPGDTLDLREAVRVVALDSAGRPLGTLPRFDRRVPEGAVHYAIPHHVVGVREGEATITLTVPRVQWQGRADAPPSIAVPVRVRADAPRVSGAEARLLAMLGGGRGGGFGGCTLLERPVGLPGRVPFRAPARMDVDCTQVEARETVGGTERRWVRALVLTRRPDPAQALRPAPDPFDRRAMLAASDSQLTEMRRRQREAEERGRHYIGGGSTNGVLLDGFEISQGYDTLFVADRVLQVPWSDSTLVVLIDQDRGTAGTTVADHMIRLELPDDYWPKQWMNGDTTFFVRPSRAPIYLRAGLSGIPGIERFLP